MRGKGVTPPPDGQQAGLLCFTEHHFGHATGQDLGSHRHAGSLTPAFQHSKGCVSLRFKPGQQFGS
jgi:hypothetical protein